MWNVDGQRVFNWQEEDMVSVDIVEVDIVIVLKRAQDVILLCLLQPVKHGWVGTGGLVLIWQEADIVSK